MASKDKNSKVSTTPKKTTDKAKVATTKAKTASTKSATIPKVTTAKSKSTTNNLASRIVAVSPTNQHLISKTKGAEMIANFLDIASKNQMPFSINKCYDFNKEIFDLIFSDTDTSGIRIYFGVNDQNEMGLVFTGIDAKFNDVYIPLDSPSQTSLNDIYGVADMGQVCPPNYIGGKGLIQLP